MDVVLTKEEQKAIRKLQLLANKWPNSLMLFSWNTSLNIIKNKCVVATINGISNDGGDPDDLSSYKHRETKEDGFYAEPNIIYE